MASFSCDKCGRVFAKKAYLKKHNERKTPCDKHGDATLVASQPTTDTVEGTVEATVEGTVEATVEEQDERVNIVTDSNVLHIDRDYMEDNKMTLVEGECINIMKKIENKTVDMILCDLPYGVTKNQWDVVIPFDELWGEYKRIIKDNGAIVLFGSQPFTTLMIASNMKDFRYSLVWEKNKFSDFLNARRKPMKTNEDICIFYKKQPTYNVQYWYSTPYHRWNTQKAVDKQSNYGNHEENISISSDGKRVPTTVLKYNRVERPAHPTQKPVDLLEWLIKSYSNTNDIVLDNCMGVGSTAKAARNTQRKFIGIELDHTYFTHACTHL